MDHCAGRPLIVKGPSLKGGKVLLGPKSPYPKLTWLPLSLLEMRRRQSGREFTIT